MGDLKQQFLNDFKNELTNKYSFHEDLLNRFEKCFNEKLIQDSEKEVIDSTLDVDRFIVSDLIEIINIVLYSKQDTCSINKFNDVPNETDPLRPKEAYLNNQYTGYTTDNRTPLLVRVKNTNQAHYTADLVDANGNVVYNIDSNTIGTQVDNNCAIHAFEQTLMLQDLVKFYHDNKITEPTLGEFIKKAIAKLKKDGVFTQKDSAHFTKLRKEIYKIYALREFSSEVIGVTESRINSIMGTLYDNLLNEKNEVNFANYLDFKKGLDKYNTKVADIDNSIKTGGNSQLKEDKEIINILQFINTIPDFDDDKLNKYIENFKNQDKINIDTLSKWELKIYIQIVAEYICSKVQGKQSIKANLDTIKKLYSIIKEKEKIKEKLGDEFKDVEFNLNRATTYVEKLMELVNVGIVDELTTDNIAVVYEKGKVINVDGIIYTFYKTKGNIKNDILEQLKNNTDKNNFDFIDIKRDVYRKNQLTQEKFNEILNDNNFKTISKGIGKDVNFLFYNKLKSLGVVSKDVSVNFGNFDFSADTQQITLFPENSKYCLVDAGNGDNISGSGVNGACKSLLNKKFNIKVEDKVKNIHTLDKNKVIDCENNCKAECVSQDKKNKVTLLKFYKEDSGKQKDGIFILYATGSDFRTYKEKDGDYSKENGMKKLENTLNSIMDTISSSLNTLSSTDTVIFGGISNAIYAGEYQYEKIDNKFNAIDLFNALVYKVKSKEKKPQCNVAFTWGVANAIDFINELDKEGKDIKIEDDILNKFGIDKDDEVHKYIKTYIDENFSKIFSKAKKFETPKKEGEGKGSNSSTPSQQQNGGSNPSNPSTPSQQQGMSGGSTQQDFQGPPPPPKLSLKIEIIKKLANILIKKEPGEELFNEYKNNDIITEEGKLVDGQGRNWSLIAAEAQEIYNKESKKGTTPNEQLRIKGQYKTQEQINKLPNYFTNPENAIGKDGSMDFTKVGTNKGDPQNPPKDPVNKSLILTKLNPVSNKANDPKDQIPPKKFDKKPHPAKTTGFIPKNQTNPEVILKDLEGKIDSLKAKSSLRTFDIKNDIEKNGLLDYLQKAKDNNVELTEEIVNDIQEIWDKEVQINGGMKAIKDHMGDELVEYVSGFSKENQEPEEPQEPQEPQEQKEEEEKQNFEIEIKSKQIEINNLIKEIKEDKSIDSEKTLNEKKKKVEKLINELKVSKQKFETDYPDEQNAEIKNIDIDALSNNLNETINTVNKKFKVENQQQDNKQEQQPSQQQNNKQEQQPSQQQNNKQEQQPSQQQETKSNNTNKNTTTTLKGEAEQIKKQNELYKFFMIWYYFQMIMAQQQQQRNNAVQQNMWWR